ncbi:hypothetical protein [Streptomyces sp. NPDC002758]
MRCTATLSPLWGTRSSSSLSAGTDPSGSSQRGGVSSGALRRTYACGISIYLAGQSQQGVGHRAGGQVACLAEAGDHRRAGSHRVDIVHGSGGE